MINPCPALVDQLAVDNCITWRQHCELMALMNEEERIDQLLEVVVRANVFSQFVTCLRSVNQRQVADVLQNGGGELWLIELISGFRCYYIKT